MSPRNTSSPVLDPRSQESSRTERRRTERTGVAHLVCDAGGVIDLSPRGIRVLAEKPWHEGHTRLLTLTDGPHSMTIEARCVWSRPDADRHHVLGLAFDHVEPHQEGMLLRFATEHAAASSQLNGAEGGAGR
ncbi:MAG: PilZ domain-containing protein [Phycisphaerae bacterium]|nr:PilZ domain-containing protein [Phycisphaerae bacterium]